MTIAAFGFIAGAVVLWLCFQWVFKTFPYLTSGAEVIYQTKIRQETHGRIFPETHESLRVLLFGSSKALAGFMPDEFDRLAKSDGVLVWSFNSGYPARSQFLGQLRAIVRHGQIPDAVILTETWQPSPERRTFFRFLNKDHETAQDLFPFRDLPRDLLNFLLLSKQHGGPLQFYAESRQLAAKMLADRGYFFIAEQSHFAGHRLPADFRLPTDQPDKIYQRDADPTSPELAELNALLTQNHIACYYAPFYARSGEKAQPPSVDWQFAAVLRDSSSPCKLVGPDYVLYPTRLFSDQMHLNPEGAKVYTQDLYGYVRENLKKEQRPALQ